MQASSPTRVCHNAWPRPSRPAQNIKFIRRGGIHPAREPRAAIGTPGFAPRLKYAPNRPPCQRGLAAGKARRLGDCPPEKYRPREPAQPGIARPQMPPPGAPPKRALPSVNGILRRNNPSVLASLGHLPLTREAKPAAVRFPARYNFFRRGVTAALPPAGWRGWFRARRRWRAASAGRRTAASARRARPSPA